MKKTLIILIIFLSISLVFGQNQNAKKETDQSKTKVTKTSTKQSTKQKQGTTIVKYEKKDLADSKSRISYSIGINLGKQIKQHQEDITVNFLFAGIKDALELDSNFVLTADEINTALNEYQKIMSDKFMKEQKAKGDINKIEGDKFLAENKTKEGIITTPSGLQYKVLKSGTGEKPADTNKVKVHYTGRLMNGKVFDSSVERNEPAVFPVKGVIKGWQEALQLMSVGDKWMLFISPDLAYGDRGAGDMIGPNEVLIFEVELLSIEN